MTAPAIPHPIGYCTNVHAGATLEATKANLDRHAVAVRAALGREHLGLGLWLSARAARDVLDQDAVTAFGDWLAERGLRVVTINGFPYGDFHGEVVKHRVYAPTWADPKRLAYTVDLARILAALVPPGADASISTLPIRWSGDFADEAALEPAFANLEQLVQELARIEDETGRRIHVDLEPEPGCLLDRSEHVVELFDRLDDRARQRLGVCHDVCHAAVMFEDQDAALDRYARHDIRVGKVQVSSAVRADFEAAEDPDAVKAALASFDEPRYLHQTVVQRHGNRYFHEDLSSALATEPSTGEWRVHFHVPIFAERLGPLATTRDEIRTVLASPLIPPSIVLEVETYAWDVLPAEHRRADLAGGIADELRWLDATLARGASA